MAEAEVKFSAACFFTVFAGLFWLIFTTITFCSILFLIAYLLHLYFAVFPSLKFAFPITAVSSSPTRHDTPTILRFAPDLTRPGRIHIMEMEIEIAGCSTLPKVTHPSYQPTNALFPLPPEIREEWKAEGFYGADGLKGEATGKSLRQRKGRWIWDYMYRSIKRKFSRPRFAVAAGCGILAGSLVGSVVLGWVVFGVAVPRLREAGRLRKSG